MPLHDRQQCRHRLNELLRAEYACAGQLQSVLQAESDALQTRDLDGLERLVSEKNLIMRQLEQLTADKQRLLAEYDRGNDPAGIEACIAWCDDTGQLRRGWQSLLKRLRNCQQQNRINGITLESNRRHAQQVLGILRGQSPLPDLYSAAGTTAQAGTAGRSLAKA